MTSLLAEMEEFYKKNHQEEYIKPEIEDARKQVHTYLLLKQRREASEHITKFIKEREVIYTTRDDLKSECWIYKDGIYIPQGRTYIKEYCRHILDIAYTTTISNEVISKIETDTYIEQDDFFKIRDIWKIAVKNGVLDIKTRQLLDNSPEYFFFNKIPVKYEPDNMCENIYNFFKDILKCESDIDVMQELFGYLLLREYRYEKAFMFLGTGRNGKGKTVELMKRFIGIENTCNIPIQSMTDESFNIGEMFNKMANIGADISNIILKETGVFKSLTGRDLISAQRKFLTRVKFTNFAKMVFCANELPITYDKTEAFFTRWIMLEFPYTFLSQDEIDSREDKTNLKIADVNMIDKISTDIEMTGLLNWAIIGLHRILENGDFSYNKSTEDVRTLWLRKSSSINAFLMDFIEEDNSGMIVKSYLRRIYSQYCKKYKLKPVSDKMIKKQLTETMGVSEERFRQDGVDLTYWSGIKIKENNEFGEVDMDDKGFSTIG